MSDQGRPLFLVVTIKPRLDRAPGIRGAVAVDAPERPHRAGVRLHAPGAAEDDLDTWVMLERFRSHAAWDEHMQQPYNTEGNTVLEDLLREPSDLRLFDEK